MIRPAVENPPKPTTDDRLALADAVRDVGLSYDPPAGLTGEPRYGVPVSSNWRVVDT